MSRRVKDRGFILVATMMLIIVLGVLFTALYTTTSIELAATRFSSDSTKGFYAAEAGLNVRAEEVRSIFVGYNLPSGSPPTEPDPCTPGNLGSGTYVCRDYTIGHRTVQTYVAPVAGYPIALEIPRGERFQLLDADEYQYSARATAFSADQRTEAILELKFKIRYIPIFQFAAFFNKDLEMKPGRPMSLGGPVHSNFDLFLDTEPGQGLTIDGQITVANQLYRGTKRDNNCGNTVAAYDARITPPRNLLTLVPGCSSRTLVSTATAAPWGDQIKIGFPTLTVPEPESFDPNPGRVYWDKADLRLVLNLDASGAPVTSANSPSGVEVRTTGDAIDTHATQVLNNCSGSIRRSGGSGDPLRAVGTSFTFRDNREGSGSNFVRMLDMDMRAVLDCLHNNNFLVPLPTVGKRLDDATERGLVFYLTVKGPRSNMVPSRYGVRIRNGGQLRSTVAGAPVPLGLSVISDQPAYIQGDYNAANRIPAAVMADVYNVLSNAFYDTTNSRFRDQQSGSGCNANWSTAALSCRVPTATTQNIAVLAGSDTTGGAEGSGGWNGSYSGGFENFPRFHESWTGIAYTWNGSFVSLNRPRRANGAWAIGGSRYNAPNRVWAFDTSFNTTSNLPPLTPRAVDQKQELFVRDYGE